MPRIKKKMTKEEQEDRKDKEVIIPVGGITDTGIIYEKEVKPEGDTPIYTEVNVDQQEKQNQGKDTKPTKT